MRSFTLFVFFSQCSRVKEKIRISHSGGRDDRIRCLSRSRKRGKERLARYIERRSTPTFSTPRPSLKKTTSSALAASVALLGIANQAMAIGVMKARKRFNVEFPDLYAKETNPNKAAFDAVQRGHQNVLENIPIFLAVQAFVALAAGPLVAAGLIAVYTAAKVREDLSGLEKEKTLSKGEKKLTLSLFSFLFFPCFESSFQNSLYPQWIYFSGYANGG